jgi:hypothetical protein
MDKDFIRVKSIIQVEILKWSCKVQIVLTFFRAIFPKN